SSAISPAPKIINGFTVAAHLRMTSRKSNMLERLLSRNNGRGSASVEVGSLALSALVVGAFVEAMLAIGGASFQPAAAAWIIVGAAAVLVAGLLIVEWSTPDLDGPRLTLAVLAGSTATSLFLVAGCFLTGARADIVFGCWTLIVVGLAWYAVRAGA